MHIFRSSKALIMHAKLLGLFCLVSFHSCLLIYFSVEFWIKMYVLFQETSKPFLDKIQSNIKKQTVILSCHIENELDRKVFLKPEKDNFCGLIISRNISSSGEEAILINKKKYNHVKKLCCFNFSTLAISACNCISSVTGLLCRLVWLLRPQSAGN